METMGPRRSCPDQGSPGIRKAAPNMVAYGALLSGYFLLKPLRDACGLNQAARDLPLSLFIVLVVVSLCWLVWVAGASRLKKSNISRVGLGAFAISLLLFWILFRTLGMSRILSVAFFVWGNVFSLSATSLFWSRMVDLQSATEGRRHFPLVAAGGTMGAIGGPALALLLLRSVDPIGVLPVVAALVGMTAWLLPKATRHSSDSRPLGGTWLEGVRPAVSCRLLRSLSLYAIVAGVVGAVLLTEQGRIVEKAGLTLTQRTESFAWLELLANLVTLFLQLMATSRVIAVLGATGTMALAPLFGALGGSVVLRHPTLMIIVIVQVARRTIDYALVRPAREMTFTGIETERKYKSKPFADVVAPRLGDALGAEAAHLCAGSTTMLVALLWLLGALGLAALRSVQVNSPQLVRSST